MYWLVGFTSMMSSPVGVNIQTTKLIRVLVLIKIKARTNTHIYIYIYINILLLLDNRTGTSASQQPQAWEPVLGLCKITNNQRTCWTFTWTLLNMLANTRMGHGVPKLYALLSMLLGRLLAWWCGLMCLAFAIGLTLCSCACALWWCGEWASW